VNPLPVPVMVTVAVPTTAVASVLIVNVEVPGVEMVELLNEEETPCGNPEIDRETSPLKPPTGLVEMLTEFDPPTPTATDAEEVENRKSGVCVEDPDTTTVIEAVCVFAPSMPEMLTV
jgi:hypothetical protein